LKIKHVINITRDGEQSLLVEKEYKYINKAVKTALDFEKINCGCEINVEITDNQNIKKLNKEFRNKDNPTDVLSFPMIEPEKIDYIRNKNNKNNIIKKNFSDEINPENGLILLGDIVISIEKAKEQSEEFNQSLERELMFLAVHSTLHLLGYDHEISEESDLIMRKKQREIIEFIEKEKSI